MTKAIHYLGAGIQTEFWHICQPIIRGELPADEVVLIQPSELSPQSAHFVEQIAETLDDETEVSVRKESLGRAFIIENGYPEIIQLAHAELTENLNEDNAIFVNVGSAPGYLGYAFFYAAYNLLVDSDTTLKGSEGTVELESSHLRENIHFYETEGKSYWGDIEHALREFSKTVVTLETSIERQEDSLDHLSSEVENYSEFFQVLNNLFTESAEGNPKWIEVCEQVDEISPGASSSPSSEQSISEFAEGMQFIFDGLRKFSEGLKIMSNDQIRRDVLVARNFTNLPHHQDVTSLLKQSENLKLGQNSDAEKLQFNQSLREELEEWIDILNKLKFRQQDLQELVEGIQTHANLHDEILNYGTSYGSFRFEGDQHHIRLPLPPSAGLRELESALVVTLFSMNSANSITELIQELIGMTLKADRTMDEQMIGEEKAAFLNEEIHSGGDEIPEPIKGLIDSLRSKVQYNLNQLEEKGFIQKEKKGRTNRIKLTQAGNFWIYTNQYNEMIDSFDRKAPNEDIAGLFEGLVTDINSSIN